MFENQVKEFVSNDSCSLEEEFLSDLSTTDDNAECAAAVVPSQLHSLVSEILKEKRGTNASG